MKREWFGGVRTGVIMGMTPGALKSSIPLSYIECGPRYASLKI